MSMLKPGPRRAAVRQIPLLAGISDQSLERIETGANWLAFQPREQILSSADQNDDVFFLISGTAQVALYAISGKAVYFRALKPGEFFGEFAAIDGKPRSAVVEAVSACQVVVMSSALFMELVRAEPAFAVNVLMHLTGLLRDLTGRVFEFSTLTVKNRIHAELLRRARVAMEDAGLPVISPAPVHAEIASCISTHREAVSREMSRLSSLGIVRRDGQALVILQMDRLERMVEDAGCE